MSAIAIVSIVGVAVATAAIIIVLSVFNGFRYNLNERLDSLTPDISVAPAYGKTISEGDSLALRLSELPFVEIAMPEVTDNALVISGAKEMPVTLRGVNQYIFGQITGIDSLLLDRTPIGDYTEKETSIAVGVAQRLGIYSAGDTLLIFAPKRLGRVNIANPLSSFISDSIVASSVFRSLQNEFDENTIIADIGVARELFQYETEATAIQIKLQAGADIQDSADQIRNILGEEYIVKDRLMQQDINFRMVEIEKWLTFILLVFILVIASFNIISTLCMIILDKGEAIRIFSYMGMNKRKIGLIFWWESILVTLIGAVSGIIIGVVVALLQEKFSIIKLAGDPENLVMRAYPVRVEWLDMAITFVPILIIGLICAQVSVAFAKSRLNP